MDAARQCRDESRCGDQQVNAWSARHELSQTIPAATFSAGSAACSASRARPQPRWPRESASASSWAAPRISQLHAAGQARSVPVHVRRSAADGPVGLQAGARAAVRQGSAGFRARQSDADGPDGGPGALSDRARALGIQTARRIRPLGQRAAALYRQDGRTSSP